MAVKRGGLGKGLDSLIPDHKPKANTSKDKVSEQASGKEKTTMPAILLAMSKIDIKLA